MKKNTSFSAFLLLCFFLVGCDERISLSVKPGGISNNTDLLWAGPCHEEADFAWQTYFKITESEIVETEFEYSSQQDCLDEVGANIVGEWLYPIESRDLYRGWIVATVSNEPDRAVFKIEEDFLLWGGWQGARWEWVIDLNIEEPERSEVFSKTASFPEQDLGE